MAGKKVNGDSTIVQLEKDKPKGKCRKWQLRVSTGKDPKTGKYKTKTRRISGTYTQAQAAPHDLITENREDQVVARRYLRTVGSEIPVALEMAAILSPARPLLRISSILSTPIISFLTLLQIVILDNDMMDGPT